MIFDHTIYCVDIYVKHQKNVDFIGFLLKLENN